MAKRRTTRSGRTKPGTGSLPSSVKKFRQSPEIEGFYRFIYENDLRTEAFEIIDRISQERKTQSKNKSKAKAKIATSK